MSQNLRALDALIAGHVFGLKTENCRPDIWDHASHYEHSPGRLDPIPAYSTDIALAIGVLERLKSERYWPWEIYCHGSSCYGVVIEANADQIQAEYGMPLPEAICRHVLHVLGVPL